MYYVGTMENAPSVEITGTNARTLRCFISPELDPTNQDIACGMTQMQPGTCSDCRAHPEGEMFICVSGEGHVRIGNEVIALAPHTVVYVPKNTIHQLFADRDTPMQLYWVLTPPFGGDKLVCDLARQNAAGEKSDSILLGGRSD